MKSNSIDIKALLQRIVEIVMPNLRHYYRMPKKARIVKAYDAGGHYYADIQILRNDESDDPDEPMIPQVELPVVWGGKDRGIVCPPENGSQCIVGFFDGDPSFPYITDIRWKGNSAPVVEIGGLVIQKDSGCKIKIDSEQNIITITPADCEGEFGGDWKVNVGGKWTVDISGKTSITSGSGIDLDGGTGALFGAVTGGNICAFTGGPHPDCSQTVKISKA